MGTTTENGKVWEIVLSFPRMKEKLKFTTSLSMEEVLLINCVLRRGISPNDEKLNGFLDSIPKETLQQLVNVADDFLEKAGLTEMGEKLKALTSK